MRRSCLALAALVRHPRGCLCARCLTGLPRFSSVVNLPPESQNIKALFRLSRIAARIGPAVPIVRRRTLETSTRRLPSLRSSPNASFWTAAGFILGFETLPALTCHGITPPLSIGVQSKSRTNNEANKGHIGLSHTPCRIASGCQISATQRPKTALTNSQFQPNRKLRHAILYSLKESKLLIHVYP